MKRLLATFILVLGTIAVTACGGDREIDRLHIDSLRISSVSTNGVQITAALRVRSRRNATVDALRFENVTINGLRVEVSPISGPILLRKSEETALTEVRLTISIRDLCCLRLLQLVTARVAHLQGEVVAAVQPNSVVRMLLKSNDLRIKIPIDLEVPLDTVGFLAQGAPF
jgi:hypothetical protein